MARRPRPPQQPAAIDPRAGWPPSGADEIEIVESKEAWSTYTLKDGTVLRLRPVLAGVFRSRTQHNEAGEPLYGIRSGLVPDFQINPKLMKGKKA